MLLVFDSHPVQYRVPVWREMERLRPGSVHVIYGSDCSVRGHVDSGFGQTVAWDDPMMAGYPSTVLNCEKGEPLSGWGSLTGDGISKMLDLHQPAAVLLTGLNYRYDLVALWNSRKLGIPVWLRCETQDHATTRSGLKRFLRGIIYKIAYKFISHFFYIGNLNRQHYEAHGVSSEKLSPARYATVDRVADLSPIQKSEIRSTFREKAGIEDGAWVVGFSGKFIPKKNPDLLYAMLAHLPEELRKKTHLYFLGSGELNESLQVLAKKADIDYGVQSFYSGFVNQSELGGHYLAMDVLVLPSRRQGETWGLVVNEAMQAGCAAVVSDAVGSGADFKILPHFETFPVEDAKTLAEKIFKLSQKPRDFDWAAKDLEEYSIEFTASQLVKELSLLENQSSVRS